MPDLNAVIDLSHYNDTVDLKKAQDAGVLAVIHKASQGTQFSDGKFRERMSIAQSIGMLRGAYHFLTNEDPVGQAIHFLAAVEDFPDALLSVDVENDPSGPSCSLQQLCSFVMYVYGKTGRWPGVYGGSYLRQITGLRPFNTISLLSNCWLWASDYRQRPAPEMAWPWAEWTLWQYTDGKVGNPPHDVAGVLECDRDIFNGPDEGSLKSFWQK